MYALRVANLHIDELRPEHIVFLSELLDLLEETLSLKFEAVVLSLGLLILSVDVVDVVLAPVALGLVSDRVELILDSVYVNHAYPDQQREASRLPEAVDETRWSSRY